MQPSGRLYQPIKHNKKNHHVPRIGTRYVSSIILASTRSTLANLMCCLFYDQSVCVCVCGRVKVIEDHVIYVYDVKTWSDMHVTFACLVIATIKPVFVYRFCSLAFSSYASKLFFWIFINWSTLVDFGWNSDRVKPHGSKSCHFSLSC